MRQNGVSIVLPVFNALESLKKCISSVLKYTDLNKNSLIIVNDCSTDNRVRSYLNEIAKITDKRIKLITNLENCGFSGSVNKGIMQSKEDVILLNSDTIVTERWIEKLYKCAYSQKGVATVTPLSNNATICSVPVPGEENDLPEHLSLEEYAKMIEDCSLQKYPRIPVAIGFCMYITRIALETVGLFDQKTFPKGYGEEQDFCFRAEQLGFIHLLCDDLFIFHEGTVSFATEEKKEFIAKNEKILKQRYEDQMHSVHLFWIACRHQSSADNIAINLKLHNNRKNILFLVQADFRVDASNNIGGTQFHVKDLTMAFCSKYNVFVVARDGAYFRLTGYIGNERISFKYYIGNPEKYNRFFDQEQEKLFQTIINALHIDLVHIHHTYQMSLDLYYVAKRMKLPVVVTLHDFYYICPNIKMLDHQWKYCAGEENTERCKECLSQQFSISNTLDYLTNWRAQHRKVLVMSDKIIVPSFDTKKIILSYYPELKEKIEVIEHGSDPYEKVIHKEDIQVSDELQWHLEKSLEKRDNARIISGWCYLKNVDSSLTRLALQVMDSSNKIHYLPVTVTARADVASGDARYLYSGFSANFPSEIFASGKLKIKPLIIYNNKNFTSVNSIEVYEKENGKSSALNVAFIGGLNIAKGSQIAYQMIKNGSMDINWFIFGGIGDGDLTFLEQKNLFKTGWYRREDLPNLFSLYKIDIVCILPIWPETFCYTITEVLLCGIPVIVTDIGALGERARKMGCGWILPRGADYKDVLNLLDEIKKFPKKYLAIREHVRNLNLRSIAEMAQDYEGMYEQLFPRSICYENYNMKLFYSGFIPEKNSSALIKQEDASYRLACIEEELSLIKSSMGYKALEAIRSLKIPFKKQIKLGLYKCFKILKRLRLVK